MLLFVVFVVVFSRFVHYLFELFLGWIFVNFDLNVIVGTLMAYIFVDFSTYTRRYDPELSRRAQKTPKRIRYDPELSRRSAKDAQKDPFVTKRSPKESQTEPKGSQREPKGNQKRAEG